MAGKRHTKSEIEAVLATAAAGRPVRDLVRLHGISEPTFYRWKAKYGHPEEPGTVEVGKFNDEGLRRLQELEDENLQLKAIVVRLTLDNDSLERKLQKYK